MENFRKGLFFAPDDGAGDGNTGGEENQEQEQQEEVNEWDAFHNSLTPEAQKLISDRDNGLKSALGKEREARDKAEKDLRDVAKDLKEGSEAQEKVLKLADEVAAESLRADFYEEAHDEGIVNLKLAFHVVQKDELFDRKGNADFKALKKDYPELFGKRKIASGDGGEGAGGDGLPREKVDMNALIRKKAGR